MTLSLYIARRFFWSFATVFGGFAAILYFIDFVEQIRKFDAGTVSLGQALELALLNLPATVYRILPLIMILATVALFLALSRSSELLVIRAAGRSALRMLVAPCLTALAIGVVAVAALNPIVAATSRQYEALVTQYSHGVTSVTSISREGLWLRQGGAGGQTVIRAERANLDGTDLLSVTFISFGENGNPAVRLEAAEARLGDGAWELREVKEWRLDTQGNPEREARYHDTMELATDLTPDQIRDSFGTPSSIPIWDLAEYIVALERAGFSARKHQVWMQMELALPLLLAAMVLVGAGFTLRHARFGQAGIMVLLALVSGLAIFFLRNFAQILGETDQIPVLLAAWTPPVAAVLLALGLLLHMEDG